MGVVMDLERDNIREALVNSWVGFFRDMGPGLPDEDARVLGNKIVELTEFAALDQSSFDEAVKMACEWFETKYLPQRLCVSGEEEPVSGTSHFLRLPMRRLSFP